MTTFRVSTTACLALFCLLGLGLTNDANGAFYGFENEPYTAADLAPFPNSTDPNNAGAFFGGPHFADGFGDDEVPYGHSNCLGDGGGYQNGDSMCGGGWIPHAGTFFTIDFGKEVSLNTVRLWSAGEGSEDQANFDASRKALVTISHGSSAAKADENPIEPNGAGNGTFSFDTFNGEGTLDDGTPVPAPQIIAPFTVPSGNFTGWYQYVFPAATAQFWRLTAGAASLHHFPSVGGVEFGRVPEPSISMLLGLGIIGLIGSRRRKA